MKPNASHGVILPTWLLVSEAHQLCSWSYH
jgi:hypothetical protein